ncbi:hypothetical protein EDB19DRAFT_1253568, partial [Suillus lakei]
CCKNQPKQLSCQKSHPLTFHITVLSAAHIQRGSPCGRHSEPLASFPVLDDLTLSDVHFDAKQRTLAGAAISLSRLQTLAFEKLDDSNVLKIVFSVLIGARLSSTIITDCKINTLGRICFTDYLTFENMDASKIFTHVLRHWNGSSLTLDNCAGVDDGFFDVMTRPFKSTSEEECYMAPRMTKLRLLNCDRFTAPALRRFTQARVCAASVPQWGFLNPLATESDEEEMLTMNTKSISWLDVRGRGPVIAEADAVWLSGRVGMFSWDALQPDGKRYTVEYYSKKVVVK